MSKKLVKTLNVVLAVFIAVTVVSIILKILHFF